MATRTMAELATAVLVDLGLVDALESPAAEDSDLVKRRYRETLEELRDDGLVYWDYDAIPYEVFPGITFYMGIVVASAFGKSIDGDIDAALESAKRRLRRRVAKRSTGEQTAFSDY